MDESCVFVVLIGITATALELTAVRAGATFAPLHETCVSVKLFIVLGDVMDESCVFVVLVDITATALEQTAVRAGAAFALHETCVLVMLFVVLANGGSVFGVSEGNCDPAYSGISPFFTADSYS